LLSAGQKTMRVMPPLTIGEEEVQKALVIMNEVLS
jgi:4-aminobutyrate aminotransferase-like enzyme